MWMRERRGRTEESNYGETRKTLRKERPQNSRDHETHSRHLRGRELLGAAGCQEQH